MAQNYIEIKNVTKKYLHKGKEFTALNNVSLNIAKGEFICLLGPSGCGKSTLMNALAGFEKVSEGSITIDNKEVEKPSIKRVTIFQNYGLFPWRSVLDNVKLGLEQLKLPKKEAYEKAKYYVDLVGLSKFADAHPRQLSGGMQQRVAIARALAVDPEIIFMDEPFGALDAITRIKLQDDILSINRTQNKTVIFVTHDIEEAVFLADRIVVMTPNPGEIKQVVKVELGPTRDRTSEDFLMYRDKIFQIFHMKKEKPQAEYVI